MGDVIYIEANSGAVKRVGRCERAGQEQQGGGAGGLCVLGCPVLLARAAPLPGSCCCCSAEAAVGRLATGSPLPPHAPPILPPRRPSSHQHAPPLPPLDCHPA